jgi:predicted metal-binding protein
MSEHIFFVCESCRLDTSNCNGDESEPAGAILLNKLQAQHQNWSRKSEFEIRGVGCLCTCHQPCVFALAGVNKPTYLFTGLPAQEIAPAILTLGEFYADSDNGFVPNYKLPEVLQAARLARIPPWPSFDIGSS